MTESETSSHGKGCWATGKRVLYRGIFIVSGVAVLSVGLYVLSLHWSYPTSAVEVSGTIIGVHDTEEGHNSPSSYRPVIKYTPPDSSISRRFTSMFPGATVPDWREGDSVSVSVMPDRAGSARHGTPWEVFMYHGLAVGGAIIVVGVLLTLWGILVEP